MLVFLFILAAQAPPPVYGPAAPPPRVALPPSAQPARSRLPLQGYITAQDYPYSAMVAREEGSVRYRLAIDPAGVVVGCSIRQSSGSAALDAATCALLERRGRFDPAIGASGRPVAGLYDGSVRWQLPAGFIAPPVVELGAASPAAGLAPPRPLAPLGLAFGTEDYPPGMATRALGRPTQVTLAVGADGRVTGCALTGASGWDALDALACRLLVDRARFEPARDSSGEARPASVSASILWPRPVPPPAR